MVKLHKMQRNSWLAEELLATEKDFVRQSNLFPQTEEGGVLKFILK
jgi:predicted Rdx family selenoprotein